MNYGNFRRISFFMEFCKKIRQITSNHGRFDFTTFAFVTHVDFQHSDFIARIIPSI